MFLPGGGAADYPPARALDKSELPDIAQDYAHAARNAVAAGVGGRAGAVRAALPQSIWSCRLPHAGLRMLAVCPAHGMPGPVLMCCCLCNLQRYGLTVRLACPAAACHA